MFLIKIIDAFFWIYMIMLFIRIISSWIPEWRDTTFIRFVSFYTDPYLNFFRQFIPPIGMLDISPIVAFFCLQVIEVGLKLLVKSLV